MPEENYTWMARKDLLTFEEIVRIVEIGLSLGIQRIRLTGGEPLLRRDLAVLVKRLAALPLADLAMTTNGLLLAEQVGDLRAAGLRRLTVSLDSVRAETFARLSQRNGLAAVFEGLEAARRLDFEEIKIDTVLLRGVNDDEIDELLAFAHNFGAELRFIEYMDVGGATHWSRHQVVSRADILARVGPVTPLPGRGSAPAERFRRANGQIFGIIASVTQPFCRDCDRARLTADGHFLKCLYAKQGLDLRQPLRSGESDTEIRELLVQAWRQRSDRGAEARAALPASARSSFIPLAELKHDLHLEMHTRGG
jgi:cyclic pyranopterin phosphate synthase